jgi:hypothetical protein
MSKFDRQRHRAAELRTCRRPEPQVYLLRTGVSGPKLVAQATEAPLLELAPDLLHECGDGLDLLAEGD